MNAKKVYSWLLLLFGEALIIVCFLYFGRNSDGHILALNIIVSSAIYLLWYIEKFVPMIDLKDKAHRDAGSIGLKYVFTTLYAILAIGAMVVFNTLMPLVVETQILVHLLLFFFLLVGLYFVFYASQKVLEVYMEETGNRSRIDDMKKGVKSVLLTIDQVDHIPPDIKARITALFENIRYISPSDNSEAIDLEVAFVKEVGDLKNRLSDFPINHDILRENLRKCEQTYNERKQIFSN